MPDAFGTAAECYRLAACAPQHQSIVRVLKLRFLLALAKPVACNAASLSFSVPGRCSSRVAHRIPQRKRNDARAAAWNWLKLLDDGDYAEAFEWEAQDFRMSRTQSQFVRYMQARRAPFGQTLSRSLVGAVKLHKFVGVPEGEYQSIIFKTAFEKKSPTAERVILVKQEAGWRVIDYRIY